MPNEALMIYVAVSYLCMSGFFSLRNENGYPWLIKIAAFTIAPVILPLLIGFAINEILENRK